MKYFTADWHLASNNVIKYARRPFKNAADAEKELLAGAETAARAEEGTLFHVGDFMLAGVDRHGAKDDVPEFDVDVRAIRRRLGGLGVGLVLLKGNHDDGHNGETDVDSMVVDLSQKYRRVRVAHYPTTGGTGRYALCGHVHDAWLVREFNGVVNVNVGVDKWNFRPVPETRLVKLLETVDYVRDALGEVRTCRDMRDLAELRKLAERAVAERRAERTAERYRKKGLTPEERERRKAAAMAAKGLV